MSKKDITILDGGMGQELYKRGIRGEQTLWSTNALINQPDIVRDIHMEFINAGATVITTNTYCCSPTRLSYGNVEDRFEELTLLACDLAQQARDQSGKDNIKIAGGLPPLYASYRPDLERNMDAMLNEFSRMAELMKDHVDLFLCETMTTADEAYAGAKASAATGKPVWLAWTLKDDNPIELRSGESIEDAFNRLNSIDIDAYLFNCCSPESITPALKQLRPLTDKTIGAYANGFTPIPEKWGIGDIEALGTRNFSPEEYGTFVKDWIDHDATIVGGCCEIGPAHIKYIADSLKID